MVTWPHSQTDDWIRLHLCRIARHGLWRVWKWFSRDHVWWSMW